MRQWIGAVAIGAGLVVCVALAGARESAPLQPRPTIGPLPGATYRTQHIQLGQQGSELFYELNMPDPKRR
jgi:hypothetical protein